MLGCYAYIDYKQTRAFSSKPPGTYTAIKILHAKSGLFRKDDIVHLSCIHLYHSAHNCRRHALCRIMKKNRSNRCLAHNMLLETTTHQRAETGHGANMSIFKLMVRYMVVRFCRARLTICLYSRSVIVGERWDPACCSHDHQQPIYSILTWKWLDDDHYDGRYHGIIIHTLGR